MREIPVETCNIPAMLTSIRKEIKSGLLLETLESCERNVFYHITEGDEDGDGQTSSYSEHSYFAPVILPQHPEVSVLVLSYKWKNCRDFDFSHFIENWGLLRWKWIVIYYSIIRIISSVVSETCWHFCCRDIRLEGSVFSKSQYRLKNKC